MLPLDLPHTTLTPPPGDRRSAVVLTGGTALHHRHLSYLLQTRFPGLVKAWFALSPAPPSATPAPLGDYQAAEQAVLGAEVARLAATASDVRPEIVDRAVHEQVLPARLADVNPYFLLILGGPLFSARILGAARGLALNAHAGWAPELRGSATTEQALYHRRTDWLGSTIHLATTAADAGPILRRSLVTAYDDDGAGDLFFRVVALGNWLMADVVGDLLGASSVPVFAQAGRGRTMRLADWDLTRSRLVAEALDGGWLAYALAEQRRY
jgi:folate-dependent phosphoribosylglycinamide formyltransferase PurN